MPTLLGYAAIGYTLPILRVTQRQQLYLSNNNYIIFKWAYHSGCLLCQFGDSNWFPCLLNREIWRSFILVGVPHMAKSSVKPRSSLVKPRSIAFSRQSGYCFYCRQPMWSENPLSFASKYQITIRQAKFFQCTGEHLKAHQDGGTATQNNIVAACLFCNQKRHQRKQPPPPEQYIKLVDQRMNQGRWHNVHLVPTR